MAHSELQPSTPQLVSTLFVELADLIRKESALLRAEMAEKLRTSLQSVIVLGVGAILLIAALLALLATIVLALATVFAPVWACLIAAGIFAVAGGLVAAAAASRIRPDALKPGRTLHEAHELGRLASGEHR